MPVTPSTRNLSSYVAERRSRRLGFDAATAAAMAVPAANRIINPFAAVDLASISAISGAVRTRVVETWERGATYVHVVSDGSGAFEGVQFVGSPLDVVTGVVQIVAGTIWMRGAVGGESIDVWAQAVYGDASNTSSSKTVVLTDEWARYGPFPLQTDPAKTIVSTAVSVLQDLTVPNPAIVLDCGDAWLGLTAFILPA